MKVKEIEKYVIRNADIKICNFYNVTVITHFSAPDSVKKIFSIEYGRRQDLTQAWKKHFMDLVRKDVQDDSSLEATSLFKFQTVKVTTYLLLNPFQSRN